MSVSILRKILRSNWAINNVQRERERDRNIFVIFTINPTAQNNCASARIVFASNSYSRKNSYLFSTFWNTLFQRIFVNLKNIGVLEIVSFRWNTWMPCIKLKKKLYISYKLVLFLWRRLSLSLLLEICGKICLICLFNWVLWKCRCFLEMFFNFSVQITFSAVSTFYLKFLIAIRIKLFDALKRVSWIYVHSN